MDHPTTSGSARADGLRHRIPLDAGWRLGLATPHPDAPAGLQDASILATVPGNAVLDLLAASPTWRPSSQTEASVSSPSKTRSSWSAATGTHSNLSE